MKIIAHKHNLYNVSEFLNQIIIPDYVEGIFIDVALTNDKQIILLSTITNAYMDLKNVEQSNIDNIAVVTPMTLENFLKLYTTPQKMIIINLLTSSVFMNYPKIQLYIQTLRTILEQFPTFNFTIVSQSQELAYCVSQEKMKHKSGFIIEDGNFNYLDVNSYIITIPLLNDKIMRQQLQNKKQVMILLNNWDDLYEAIKYFANAVYNQTLTQEEVDQIFLIGFYPGIIYRSIQDT